MSDNTLRKKAENFWYYYKWYVVGGVFLLLALAVGIRSCVMRKKPDLYVLYACDSTPDPVQVQELESWFEKRTTDRNGDGEISVQIIAASTTDMWNGTNSTAVLVQVNYGNAVLYLLTPETYRVLHQNEVLATPDPGESPYWQEDRYDLTASGRLAALEAFGGNSPQYYLSIRKVAGTSFESSESHKAQDQLARDLLRKLVEEDQN